MLNLFAPAGAHRRKVLLVTRQERFLRQPEFAWASLRSLGLPQLGTGALVLGVVWGNKRH